MNEKKFDIHYVIGSSEKRALKELKQIGQYKKDVSPDGWILIRIGDYEFGFLPEDDSPDGFELLDNWFDSFKSVYIELKRLSRAVLEYWDNSSDCFVFEKKNNTVRIQYYERIYPVVNGRLATTETPTTKLNADVVVSETVFFTVIKTRVNEFWSEVGVLNPILKEYVEQFKIVS